MSSLFLKTLLWFLATAILTMIAVVASAALSAEGERARPVSMLMSLQLEDARHAYEHHGREGLARAMHRLERITESQGILTDGEGRDLLTGEDRSSLIDAMRRRSPLPFWMRNRPYLARQSSDGQYWFLLAIDRRNWLTWFVHPRNFIVILGVLLLLCYAFARHLTDPVHQMQVAADRLGRGDLTIRLRSKRRDELGQLARSFDRMADRLQTLLEAERRLLLDISHELRSPLARLGVALELARTSPDPEKHFDRVENEAARLNSLVGELLQVTRAEADPSTRRREHVDLTELLSEIVDDTRIEAEARGCGIAWTPGPPVTILGDEELLRRAIENILRNAIRYEPQGGEVEVSMISNNGLALIEIRDHGPGVPPGAEARIFDAFYRVDADRDRASGGVGLGLSIARRSVELHGGSIIATNADPGLVVSIQLNAQ